MVNISFFRERRCAAHMHGARQQNCGAGSATKRCASNSATALTSGDGQQADKGPQALHGPEKGQAQRVAAGHSKERGALGHRGAEGGRAIP